MTTYKNLFRKSLALGVFLLIFSAVAAQEKPQDKTYAAAGQDQTPDSYAGIVPSVSAKQPVKTKKTAPDTPVELGDSSIFTYTTTGTNVKQEDISFYYYPEFDETGFLLKDWIGKVIISFDTSAGELVQSAFKQYEQEFNSKLLKIKDSKTAKEYGDIKCRYSWGTIGTANQLSPKVSLGYVFVQQSPYFALTLWPAKASGGRNSDVSINKTTILFNKAQARSLIKALQDGEFSSK